MTLTLFMHPLASFCHKVLIALYENETEFSAETVDLGNPESAAAHLARWPVGRIPVLHDTRGNRVVAETSIIIEYLEAHAPGATALLPSDDETRLEARLWDRFFYLYVSVPMQKIVTDRIRPETGRDPMGVAEARKTLDTAYGMVDGQVASRQWAAGDSFTIADCAAAPALFFALIVHPAPGNLRHLHAYFERLLNRQSVTRTLDEARPYFRMFPYVDAMPARFLEAAGE